MKMDIKTYFNNLPVSLLCLTTQVRIRGKGEIQYKPSVYM